MYYSILRDTFSAKNQSANEELLLVYYIELTQSTVVSGYVFPLFQWANEQLFLPYYIKFRRKVL